MPHDWLHGTTQHQGATATALYAPESAADAAAQAMFLDAHDHDEYISAFDDDEAAPQGPVDLPDEDDNVTNSPPPSLSSQLRLWPAGFLE